jgi:hypothetical protein
MDDHREHGAGQASGKATQAPESGGEASGWELPASIEAAWGVSARTRGRSRA